MNRYAKTIAAVLGAISTWGITASPDGITGNEWFGLLGALAAVLAVYAVPNSSPAPVIAVEHSIPVPPLPPEVPPASG